MTESIETVIHRIRELAGRRIRPEYHGRLCPFELSTTFVSQAEKYTGQPSADIPRDLQAIWREFDSVRLFEDATYGQWGLHLLSESESADATKFFATSRPAEFEKGDSVVGEFLGDSDLLIVRTNSNARDFGATIVALPLDGRKDWYRLSESLGNFLLAYLDAMGDKFWEAGLRTN